VKLKGWRKREKGGWKQGWGSKRAKLASVFSIKGACKGACGENRESETSL
jgi:hypothetical protein